MDFLFEFDDFAGSPFDTWLNAQIQLAAHDGETELLKDLKSKRLFIERTYKRA